LIEKGADVNQMTKEGDYTLSVAESPEMIAAVKGFFFFFFFFLFLKKKRILPF